MAFFFVLVFFFVVFLPELQPHVLHIIGSFHIRRSIVLADASHGVLFFYLSAVEERVNKGFFRFESPEFSVDTGVDGC